ncbi:chemotaxis protein MotB [Pseudovibrio denitrificans]|uniref:Chemotaxis protein MotB n=1 Tax=Pseudovibrio denitrificans TaxID=258256 RepID=A0A1I6YKP9_9HYPH|nr:flagellar motor protein MotB [Pseudovibrio denitrificans]SFT51066.1 chemotaxis protein MotB [Pseudovibrio denitrificans]
MTGRKRKKHQSGVPGWMVTFADLMALLVVFFVLIISFSIQDKEKLQVVAGSIQEAFGIKDVSKKRGIIEVEGIPLRDYMKDVSRSPQDLDSDFAQERHDEKRRQGPEADTNSILKADIEQPRQFATAAVSLRQAWQEMPEITDVSSNIILEETEDGLNILLIDQEGRSMFKEGSKFPYETTRRLLAKMAPILSRLPNRIHVTGHTTAGQTKASFPNTTWDLSADRANVARQILSEYGVPHDQFHGVTGKADIEPLFPNDPYLIANRRVEILLMAEAPPLPPSLRP